MATQKIYDISSKLSNTKPKLKLDKDHVYEVDSNKNTVIQMQELQKNGDADDHSLFVLFLGEENAKDVEEWLNSCENYTANLKVVMLSMIGIATGESYEDLQERFQNISQGQ